MNHREGLLYFIKSAHGAITQIYSSLHDLIFDSYAGLYGYNDRVLITESKLIPYTYYNTHPQ